MPDRLIATCACCAVVGPVILVAAIDRDRDLAICHACATVDAPRDWFLTHVAALRGRSGTSTLDIGPALATAQAWALFARGFDPATPDTYAPMGVVAPRGDA